MSLRFAIAGSVVCLTSAYFYTRHLHRSLASEIQHKNVSSDERKISHMSRQIESIPDEVIAQPEKFRIIHESDEKACTITIPDSEEDAERLFTALLRRDMSCFSRMPQCWILRMMAKSPEQTKSFSTTHIEALDFKQGDVFCGFNRVLMRSPTKIEIELLAPPGMDAFSGRLILSLRAYGNGAMLTTDTIQWTEAAASTVMPLDRAPAKFLHQMASWWLLVTGAKYLEDLRPAAAS